MANKLSELNIKNAKHSGKSKNNEKLQASDNLFLIIKPNNSKSWMYRYTLDGKSKSMGLGGYPTVKTKEARDLVYKYNNLKAKGIDPKLFLEKDKMEGDAKLFSNISNEWLEKKSKEWAQETYRKSKGYLENDILPVFKNRYIDKIEYIEIANFLKRFKDTPTKQNKIKVALSGIYKLAKANGLCQINHINSDLCYVMEKEKNMVVSAFRV